MIKTAFHATNSLEAIQKDGLVKPVRLSNVYLIEEKQSAEIYAKRFGCQHVIEVEYDSRDVENTWRPSYIDKGKVIKLLAGKMARYINRSPIEKGGA